MAPLAEVVEELVGLAYDLAEEAAVIGVRDKLPFSVRGGRLVVFGTGDLIANTRLALVGNWNIFLGAEGTLGVVTEATMRIVPLPELQKK